MISITLNKFGERLHKVWTELIVMQVTANLLGHIGKVHTFMYSRFFVILHSR